MKNGTLVTVGLVACIITTAFTYRFHTKITARDIQKNFVRIKENQFLDKYEVSNSDYRKFLSFLKQSKQDDLFGQYQCDSVKWYLNFGNEQLRTYYHSHSSYDDYPVVLISYDAAMAYCTWLTNQYNADHNRKFSKVIFRLPTEQEWTYAASNGKTNKMYPWDNYYLRNGEGKFLCNYRHLGDESITFDPKTKSYKVLETFADRPVLPSPVKSFYPTAPGLHNLSGNVAEMVAEKGLAKGGSFNDPGSDVTIACKKYYVGSSAEVGFRVLMEVVEK